MTASEDRISRRWPLWARHWRYRLGRWRNNPDHAVMDILGTPFGGNRGVPGDWRRESIRPKDRGQNRRLDVMVGNDGFDLSAWWYYDDAKGEESPAFSISRGEAHRLMWFILRWWAVEWFGLRRKVWYWALHRSVERTRTRIALIRERNGQVTSERFDDFEQCQDHDREGIDLRPEGAPWAPSTYHCVLRRGHDGPPEYRDVAL